MADSFGGQAGGLGGVIAAFGGSDAAPKPKYYQGALPLLRGVSGVGRDVLGNLRAQLPSFYSGFAEGTERQRGLQGEQENVLRTLLNRRLASNPQDQLRQTLGTLTSFINPNVVQPLAQFDVNNWRRMALARGINTNVPDSTAYRLGAAAQANRRYYDTFNNVLAQTPNLYNQIRNAGVTDEMLAAGAIPAIQQGYRALDIAPLVPLQASLDVAQQAAGIPAAYGGASRANIYGFRQPMNVADRFGAAGQSLWNTVKDAAAIYSSLYGAGAIPGVGGGGGARPATAAPGGAGYPYFQQPPIAPSSYPYYPSYGGYAAPTQ